MKRLIATGNTKKIKNCLPIKVTFETFAAKYVNLIVKKSSAHENYFREAT